MDWRETPGKEADCLGKVICGQVGIRPDKGLEQPSKAAEEIYLPGQARRCLD